jgi:hypothetical protein
VLKIDCTKDVSKRAEGFDSIENFRRLLMYSNRPFDVTITKDGNGQSVMQVTAYPAIPEAQVEDQVDENPTEESEPEPVTSSSAKRKRDL